jgi:excisionase family DNA binding protein
METEMTYLTRAEVAKYLGISERTVDRYAKAGSLTVYRLSPVNRFVRFSWDEVKKLATPIREGN